MFNWVENRLLAKGLKYWAHASSQPNQAEKVLSQKICMTLFLKKRKVIVRQ